MVRLGPSLGRTGRSCPACLAPLTPVGRDDPQALRKNDRKRAVCTTIIPTARACHKPSPPCETALPKPGSPFQTKETRPRPATAVPEPTVGRAPETPTRLEAGGASPAGAATARTGIASAGA